MKVLNSLVTVVKTALKIILAGLILVLIVPLAYLAWRAGQPMDMPQFGGLSYYQFMNERRQAYLDLAKQYQANHPDKDAKYGICFYTEVGLEVFAGFPSSGFYTLAGIYPQLESFVDPRDLRKGSVPRGVTWPGFLPAWWETYEKFVWGMAERSPHVPVPYCRIPPS
ncbi:MAG: hypothetical protein FJZ87_09400 [Chloroflexi bacterium]|nr:hypothetical protein [Chloroflexota bacterium]